MYNVRFQTKMFAYLMLFFVACLLWPSPASAGDHGVDSDRLDAAVRGGLEWLAGNQVELDDATGRWEAHYGAAGTGIAGLAFLAHGHLPGDPQYGPLIRRALNYIKARQDADGFVSGEHGSMYEHSICTLFVLSYLGMADESESEDHVALAEWARRAVDLTLRAQKTPKSPVEQGGWRYEPDMASSDVSHTTWQLLLLHAARQAGFDVPPEAFDDAMRYVNSGFVETPEGVVGYTYRPGVVMDEPWMSSTGGVIMLNRIIADHWNDDLQRASQQLRRFRPAWDGALYRGYFYYGNFYIAQGMFHLSEDAWNAYAPHLQRVLVDNQAGDGSWGFPPNTTQQAIYAGTAYSTGMALLMLAMDNQHLPVLQRQN